MKTAESQENRTVILSLRLTEEENRKLEKESRDAGLNTSQYIRLMLFRVNKSKPKSPSKAALMSSFNEIRSLMYEILKVCRRTADALTLERAVKSAIDPLLECRTLLERLLGEKLPPIK